MASIQCKNCKHGIHYHGIPSDIEYIAILKDDWDRIVSSSFDPKKKIIDQKSGYPKFFRTDSIEEDFPEMIQKFWKCPNCGSLIFFDHQGCVTSVYIFAENEGNVDGNSLDYVLFNDYQWDELTELGCSNFEISKKNPVKSTMRLDNSRLVIVSSDNRRQVYSK